MIVETPKSWEAFPLSTIAEIDRNGVDPSSVKAGTRYVGLEHIDSQGNFVDGTTIDPRELASTKFTFDERHVLYGKLRPYLKKTARPTFKGICSTDILPILPGPTVERNFLYYFLRLPKVVDFATRRCSGANLPRLSPSQLAEFPVPLPCPSDPAKSLAEQHRIAAILDKADSIRRKRQMGLDDAQGLPRALFLHTFGDAFHNPHGFPVKQLSELIIDGDSINYGVVQPGNETPTGVPIVRVGDLGPDMTVRMDGLKRIEPAIEKQYSRSRLVGDEILIGCVGSIGLIALATPALAGSNIVRAVARVRCGPSVNRIYLAWSLSLPLIQAFFKRETRTVSQPTLNIGHIEMTPVMLPDRRKQDAFAAVVDQFTSTRKRQTEATKQADGLFDSLVQRAFRGEL